MANETDPGPEPAGGTDYARYLLIDDLLGLQRPITPEAHDELPFIIVHQAYELWFKLMLHELERAEAELRAGRPHAAIPWLKRIVAIDRLFLAQLDVLETMGPEGFLEFRDPLAPASGFQSRQFRDIEAACPGLYEGFCAGAGLPLGEEHRAERVAALADLYRDDEDDPCACRPPPGLRAARRPRRDGAALALPPHADGGARDRQPRRHGRLARGRVPARDGRPALRRRAVGGQGRALAPV